MKLFNLFIVLLLSLTASSQFELDDFGHGISFRGKILGGPTSTENHFGRMLTLGGEFRFFSFHAIGIDFVHFRDKYSYESLSASGIYENNGTYEFTRRNYALLDYRFYLNYWESLLVPYVNILTKIGDQK